jgi:DNA ligase-1
VTATRLAEWAAERAGLPFWLFEESYAAVGDLAETIALILPDGDGASEGPLAHWIGEVQALQPLPEDDKKPRVLAAWAALGRTERFLFNKLLTGGFRVGVSQKLMTRALATATGTPEAEMAHRLMGEWLPERTSWDALVHSNDPGADLSRPYPFYLAYQIEGTPDGLGDPADWFAEWKWDGIRGQLIRRGGEHYLWSRGEELMTDRFPEFARSRDWLPEGTVSDGEVLAFAGGRPLPFAALQQRIGRKTVPTKVLAEAPVVLMAYDLLEADGADLREVPFADRRARLAALRAEVPPEAPLQLSPEAVF